MCPSEIRRDPGIPNSCPFKADILANVARRKAMREAAIAQQREERRSEEERLSRVSAAESEVTPVEVDVDDRQKLEKILKQAKAATAAFEAAAADSAEEVGPSGERRLALASKAAPRWLHCRLACALSSPVCRRLKGASRLAMRRVCAGSV